MVSEWSLALPGALRRPGWRRSAALAAALALAVLLGGEARQVAASHDGQRMPAGSPPACVLVAGGDGAAICPS